MLDTLKHNPQIGMASSFGSAFVAWIDVLTPIATFISICIGIAIGLVTLGLKFNEWKKQNKENSK